MTVKCNIEVPDYVYLAEYVAEKSVGQPDYFININGEPEDPRKIYSESTGDDNFDWFDQSAYNITVENSDRNFTTINRKDIIINTIDAKFEINIINKNLPLENNDTDIVSFLLIPYQNDPKAQIIDLKTMGKTIIKFDIFFYILFFFQIYLKQHHLIQII